MFLADAQGIEIARRIQTRIHRLNVTEDETKEWIELLLHDLEEHDHLEKNIKQYEALGTLLSAAGVVRQKKELFIFN